MAHKIKPDSRSKKQEYEVCPVCGEFSRLRSRLSCEDCDNSYIEAAADLLGSSEILTREEYFLAQAKEMLAKKEKDLENAKERVNPYWSQAHQNFNNRIGLDGKYVNQKIIATAAIKRFPCLFKDDGRHLDPIKNPKVVISAAVRSIFYELYGENEDVIKMNTEVGILKGQIRSLEAFVQDLQIRVASKS